MAAETPPPARAAGAEVAAAPTAEEYRVAAILALGLLLKTSLVAALAGLLGWGVRAARRRLRRGGPR